jgi:hypothetical protein
MELELDELVAQPSHFGLQQPDQLVAHSATRDSPGLPPAHRVLA